MFRSSKVVPRFSMPCKDSLLRNFAATSCGKGKQFSSERLMTWVVNWITTDWKAKSKPETMLFTIKDRLFLQIFPWTNESALQVLCHQILNLCNFVRFVCHLCVLWQPSHTRVTKKKIRQAQQRYDSLQSHISHFNPRFVHHLRIMYIYHVQNVSKLVLYPHYYGLFNGLV